MRDLVEFLSDVIHEAANAAATCPDEYCGHQMARAAAIAAIKVLEEETELLNEIQGETTK